MSEWSKDQDQPAMTLAAIRWYAISIEKLSMDLYVTDASTYPQVKDALDKAVSALAGLHGQLAAAAGGCPPGYKNCDGVCMPICPPPPG